MKIAICTPIYRDASAEYTASLAHLLIRAGDLRMSKGGVSRKPIVRYFPFFGCASVAHARETLTNDALGWGADAILWIDDDIQFPSDSLEILASTGLPAVGCNYARRSDPTGPNAQRVVDDRVEHVWTTNELARENVVEPVLTLGLGLFWVTAAAIRRIQPPYFVMEQGGEDGYFCRKLGAAGVPIHLHHRLSWELGHKASRMLTNADALADRDRWDPSDLGVMWHRS